MQIKLSLRFITAFLLLQIVMLELHEMAHIITGYLICGCWGIRDFNGWQLCIGCNSAHPLFWIATLAGPAFSVAVMWLGMRLLSSVNGKRRAIGFSLIFSSIPFGRISEAMKGAGDEMVVSRYLLQHHFNKTEITLITCSLLLLLLTSPVIKAARLLTNKFWWLYLVGFLTLPLVFILLYILVGMNSLLNTGLLSTPWMMGTPLLITVHTLLAVFLLWLFRKNLSAFHS